MARPLCHRRQWRNRRDARVGRTEQADGGARLLTFYLIVDPAVASVKMSPASDKHSLKYSYYPRDQGELINTTAKFNRG